MSKPSILSPARSDGAALRRRLSRRTLSVPSPARSDTSAKLVSLITLSPLGRRSVLQDDTEIDAPRSASWWKRLEGSSREVLEALDTNRMPVELPFEEEVEVEKEKQSQSLPESSDNESVASIVVPQRRLFSTKPQPPSKFGEMMGSRKSLGRTNLDDDNTIYQMPKNLFNKDKSRGRPVFPAALLNSTNKTFNKTIEPDVNERQGRNLFGQAGTKRKKTMFTDFVLSESEDDSEIQHKVFGFKKNDKRLSSGARKRRMPSLTPSVTTDIDMDDWNLLPSSTMIGNGSGQLEVSIITNNDESEPMEIENQDVTLTEENHHNASTSKKRSLNRTRFSKSKRYDDESDKTLTKEDEENEHDNEDSHKANNSKELQISNEDKSNEQDDEGNAGSINESSAEVREENHHNTSTSKKRSLNRTRFSKSKRYDDKSDKALTNEDEENEHDNEDSHKANNSKELQISNEDKSNEQDDEGNAGSIKESSAEVREENHHNTSTSKKQSLNRTRFSKSKRYDDESDKTLTKEDEENEHDNEDSHEANNSTEEQISNEDKSNEQDDESNAGSINEPSAEVSDDNDCNDTVGRNREKDVTPVKSPEAVLQNMSNDMSFRPIGRSTSFRKSKIVIDDVNLRHTLIPIQESIAGSDGSRNSSTEGSGWDSHRTTRKTLRQTFGKDFTPRKSLRTLVMEKSAKRQTEIDKNTSKMNKTGNKTVLEDQRIRDKRVSDRNMSSDQLPHTKSPALGISAHHVSHPRISKPKVSFGKSGQDISEAEMSNREESINISDRVQAPDDSGPEISMHASYGSGMSAVASHRESNNISVKKGHSGTVNQSTAIRQAPARIDADIQEQEELDYDPSLQEDSTQNYSRADESNLRNKDAEDEILNMEDSTPRILEQMADKEESEKGNSELEASDQEIETESENEIEAQESDRVVEPDESEDEFEPRESEEEIEADESEQEVQVEEFEPRESEEEIEADESEQEVQVEEVEPRESEEEIEADESEQEVQVEEIEPRESEEEIEADESEQDVQVEEVEPRESEEEIEADESEREVQVEEIEQEEPQSEHEMEESAHEVSQEIEAESNLEESQQAMEIDSDRDKSEQNVSQEYVNVAQESDPESDRDSDDRSRDMDSEVELIYQEDSVPIKSPSRSSRQTERIVFDNEMSDQEIDYEVSERISRQITNDDISEQVSEGEMEQNIEYSRHSNQAENQNVSVGTKKSLMMIHMEKIAQENMEMRVKIREKVQKSLKQKPHFNRFTSPIQSKFSYGRIKKPETIKLARKPRKPTALLMGPLPKEFMEDLKYKPPKRFQPANAPWITKRLYKFLESKLEPKYDYRARVRAEELVQHIYSLTKLARRHDVAPQAAVDELKREMARLHVVTTHYDFYEFFHEFMPREVRVKVNPDIVNRIPMPRNGVFADILQARQAVG